MKNGYVYRLVAVLSAVAFIGASGAAFAQATADAPKPPAPAAPKPPAPAAAKPAAAKPGDSGLSNRTKLDILPDTPEAGTKDEIEAMIRGEMGENAVGDNKQFTVKTEDDMTGIAKGDLYKNEDTIYKVMKFELKGAKGGVFVAQRIAGQNDPQRRWIRVSGSGPARMSSSLSLLDLYIQGGPFLHPIAVLFVVMVILTVNGLFVYRRGRICPDDFAVAAEEALAKSDLKAFEALSRDRKGLLPAMCRAMVHRFDTTTADEMRSAAEGTAATYVYRLRIPVRALNLIAVAAPLLGLLGTIVGMVIVFEGVAGSTGAAKASVLASGIRVKLFSTASALIVAIPALFIFFYFNQRLNLLVAETNNVAERFLAMATRIKVKMGLAGHAGGVAANGKGLPEEHAEV
jgi:biopolymer transport protein ExbB